MQKNPASPPPQEPARTQVAAQDLIDALTAQRNDALNAAALANAALRSLAQRVAELQSECERLKSEPSRSEQA